MPSTTLIGEFRSQQAIDGPLGVNLVQRACCACPLGGSASGLLISGRCKRHLCGVSLALDVRHTLCLAPPVEDYTGIAATGHGPQIAVLPVLPALHKEQP
jgi:hypothetical protein